MPKQGFGSSKFRDKKVHASLGSMCIPEPENSLASLTSEASASCLLSYGIKAAQTCFVRGLNYFIYSEKHLR